jgi:acyl-CoA thioesterase FadM
LFYGDLVTVESRATRIGRSSFTLEHRLVAETPGQPPRMVAVSDSVLVRFDYASQRSIPLDDDQVAALEAFEGRSLHGPVAG